MTELIGWVPGDWVALVSVSGYSYVPIGGKTHLKPIAGLLCRRSERFKPFDSSHSHDRPWTNCEPHREPGDSRFWLARPSQPAKCGRYAGCR